MNTQDTLTKLNTRYAGSAVTAAANAGDWAKAAELSGKLGMWGLWAECRSAAGLPNDDAAKAAFLAELAAARKAKFSK